MPGEPCDLLISAIETNDHHGVGILLRRFFPDSTGFVTLRSATMYRGAEDFGRANHEITSSFLPIAEVEARLRELLARYSIRRILCVPYFREDFIHGVIARRLTGAPLCTYVMDDQNVFASKVPDHWVAELLRVSDLRLGISPELCAAYRHKFGLTFDLLPPVLERREPLVPCYWQPDPAEPLRVAMIGNVWTDARFGQLRALARATGLQLDWYGNGPKASWLSGAPEEWEADHIHCAGFLPEEDLIASLASYSFIIVPSGSLDHEDDNIAFSRLSLPSRLLFLHARTDTPVLVLGSADTAAGRFVRRLGTGLCAGYTVEDLRSAIDRLTDEPTRRALSSSIRRVAPHLSLPDAGSWIWARLAGGPAAPAPWMPAFGSAAEPDSSWLAHVPTMSATRPAPTSIDLRDFAFLRAAHLSLLTQRSLVLPAIDDIELTHFLRMVAEHVIIQSLPQGGDVLILDPHATNWITDFPRQFRCWQIKDISAWLAAGLTDQSPAIVCLAGGPPELVRPAAFAAIVSSNWFDLVKSPAELDQLHAFLAANTQAGGLNFHGSNGVLHPNYFWTGPAHAHLRRCRQIAAWPGLDDLLSAPDLYLLSQKTYERLWQPAAGKSYAEFGRPLGLFLGWREPPARFHPPVAAGKSWWARAVGFAQNILRRGSGPVSARL